MPTQAPAGPAVVLLSGGLDSATVLAIASAAGHGVHALSFRYGQRHDLELTYAKRQAERNQVVAHELVELDHLGRLVARTSALVRGSALELPRGREGRPDEIPVTYVPARNTLFLAYALAWAEVVGAVHIFLGVNAVDYSGYPDCRPEFLAAFEHLANLATRTGVEGQTIHIDAPLLDLRKHEIIALGREHGVDYRDTLSCYDPVQRDGEAHACGRCDSCGLRMRGFEQAGLSDPARYV